MEPARSAVMRSHFPHRIESQLLGLLNQVDPEHGQMVRMCIDEKQDVLRAVGVLCLLYRWQDRCIHAFAVKQDPSLSWSFGDREWAWIEQGGPQEFFRRIDRTLRDHHVEVFDASILEAAWDYFQILLTAVHIAYMARILGHVPSQPEYCNDALVAWYGRLALRFGPLRQAERYVTQ